MTGAAPFCLKQTVLGTLLVPAVHEDCNVQALRGAVEVLTQFVREHGLRVEADQGILVAENCNTRSGRGRRRGSTNWSQTRWNREYTRAAGQTARPIRRTLMAGLMGLAYHTFMGYYDRWGPAPDQPALGD